MRWLVVSLASELVGARSKNYTKTGLPMKGSRISLFPVHYNISKGRSYGFNIRQTNASGIELRGLFDALSKGKCVEQKGHQISIIGSKNEMLECCNSSFLTEHRFSFGSPELSFGTNPFRPLEGDPARCMDEKRSNIITSNDARLFCGVLSGLPSVTASIEWKWIEWRGFGEHSGKITENNSLELIAKPARQPYLVVSIDKGNPNSNVVFEKLRAKM